MRAVEHPILFFFLIFLEVARTTVAQAAALFASPPCLAISRKRLRHSLKFLPQVGRVAKASKLGWERRERETRSNRDSNVQQGELTDGQR